MAKKKYKLLVGTHQEEGKEYSGGQVVESKHDLVKMFPNRFEEYEEPRAPRDTPNDDHPSTKQEVTEASSRMDIGDGSVTSASFDTTPPRKIGAVPPAQGGTRDTSAPGQVGVTPKEGEEGDEEQEGDDEDAPRTRRGSAKKGKKGTTRTRLPGEDHTADFEGAKEAGVKIRKDGRLYHVYDDEGKELSEGQEITNKQGVEDFIKELQ